MAIEGRSDSKAGGRIRYGMVGGGEGAFIGAVHRLAARMDDDYVFVAGALSSTPEKAQRSGEALGLDPARIYPDFETMAAKEKRRKDGIEAVSIVTPNHMHAPAAEAFIKAGIHIICDKPVTTTLKDALRLKKLAQSKGVIFAVTHNYTGYPLIRQARDMVKAGELGKIQLIQVEYPQDWLTTDIEHTGQKQAGWRTDPARSGAGGCIGDIGTHAFNLSQFVGGLEVSQILAELSTFVEGRPLDDNVQILLRYTNGARGALWASQVAPGNENGLQLRVYGTKAGFHWRQDNPNYLFFTPLGEPTRIITRGSPAVGAASARMTRVPPGHPEGYLEGFANIYTEIARAIRAARSGEALDPAVTFPGIDDGIAGMAFIEAAVKSSNKGGIWVGL